MKFITGMTTNISTMAGRINITDKAGNKILHLSDKALIHNTNLLETIINTFGANEIKNGKGEVSEE